MPSGDILTSLAISIFPLLRRFFLPDLAFGPSADEIPDELWRKIIGGFEGLAAGLWYHYWLSQASIGGKHRFEREKERKVAAYRRALLRKESEIYEWGRRIRELEARLSDEAERLQSSSLQFSDLLKVRQASMALKDSGKILSISRLCCVLRGVYMKNYVFLLVIVPTFVLAVIFTVRKFLTFPGHYGNPNHHHSTKAIPHYYHENASMETLCKLHGWGFVNILDGRVYDPVLFSNELELLAIRWRELYPYVTQCVILESTRRLQGCLSLLYLQSIGMFGFVEPR
ncbi:unnamed protein product [Arabidopsis lyrata]|nr:unnamed protein product [Arabidopsis lyrata]